MSRRVPGPRHLPLLSGFPLLSVLLGLALVSVLLLPGPAAAADRLAAEHLSVGPGRGIVVESPDRTNPCPPATSTYNHDGGFENGYMWRYGGIVPPDYGAFAEGLKGASGVCGAAFWFTTLSGLYTNQAMDCYVWDSEGGNPHNVLSLTTGVHIASPALWPSISQHDVDINDAYAAGELFFVGYWGDWPGLPGGWFVAADLDGPGGAPRTRLAPGSGYGTGWTDPSVVWGPTQSLGIGGYLSGPLPDPIRMKSWGRIKSLF